MPLPRPPAPFLASACLCGVPCRYDGKSTPHPALVALYERGLAVPVCPEVLGGLFVPREPCEIRNGAVVDRAGRDVTRQFAEGAAKTLALARERGLTVAVLKERSPSCGTSRIYDGSFSSRVIPGSGVTAALLREGGLTLCSEENFLQNPFFYYLA